MEEQENNLFNSKPEELDGPTLGDLSVDGNKSDKPISLEEFKEDQAEVERQLKEPFTAPEEYTNPPKPEGPGYIDKIYLTMPGFKNHHAIKFIFNNEQKAKEFSIPAHFKKEFNLMELMTEHYLVKGKRLWCRLIWVK